MEIINIKDRLPQDNQYVVIHLTKNNWGDIDDKCGDRYWKVAKFIRGISKSERNSLDKNDARKRTYYNCDEEGNNLLPYCWEEFGPSTYFGQEVDFWIELPRLQKLWPTLTQHEQSSAPSPNAAS